MANNVQIESTVPQEPKTRTYATATQTSVRPVVPVKMARSYKKVMIVSIVGLIITILGIIVGSLWVTLIYDMIFVKILTLTPVSFTHNLWVKTPEQIPVYLKFYMFNWTNPRELYTQGAKLHFQELGPYVFREVDTRVNIVWNKNGTVTFLKRREWFFEESMTNGKLTDEITNLNPIAVTVAHMVKFKPPFIRKLLNEFMVSLGESLVLTKSVNKLLFEGFDDKLLDIARKMKVTTIPFTKFAWFYGRNGSDTYDGTYNMLTGADNLYNMGMLKEWNFSNRTNKYEGSCDLVGGTLGDFWPPLPNNQTVSIFIPDICTTLDLSYVNKTEVQGITGIKFAADKYTLDNGQLKPSRQCFCPNGNCGPSGTLNISSCKFGAPAYLSLPHFYLADPSYLENITGLLPDKEKHSASFAIEPSTGIPLMAKARMQLNVLVESVANMSIFENITTTYVPLLWFAQEGSLPAEYANLVQLFLILKSLGSVTFFGIAGIGLLIFFIGLFMYVRQRWQGEEDQVLISKYDGDVRTRDEM